jgi:hypothetical protein
MKNNIITPNIRPIIRIAIDIMNIITIIKIFNLVFPVKGD